MRTPARAQDRGLALAIAIFLISLAGDAEPRVYQGNIVHDPGASRILVNPDPVVLQVSIHDREGRFVSGLRERDFEVYEDGIRQAIRFFRRQDIPVTVGLVIDHSESMASKLPDVAAAARTFVQASNPEDRIFVVNFNQKVTWGLGGAMSFTNRPDQVERAISSMPAGGMTALYDAVAQTLERLQADHAERKVLIVISDGGDNASSHGQADVVKMVEHSSVVVYTIGIFDAADRDRNPDVLRRLARAAGGEAFFPGEHSGLVAILERIAREIRHQYTLGYVSSNAAPSSAYRAIRVTTGGGAANRKLLVRARPGYIAGGEQHPVNREMLK